MYYTIVDENDNEYTFEEFCSDIKGDHRWDVRIMTKEKIAKDLDVLIEAYKRDEEYVYDMEIIPYDAIRYLHRNTYEEYESAALEKELELYMYNDETTRYDTKENVIRELTKLKNLVEHARQMVPDYRTIRRK